MLSEKQMGERKEKDGPCEWAVSILEHCDFVVFSEGCLSIVDKCN